MLTSICTPISPTALITPEELVGAAQRCELAAIALTDHDSVEGCAATARACAAAGIEFIPGTELTAEQDGNELHILGYFLDTQNPTLLARDRASSRPCGRTAFAKWWRGSTN